MARYGLFAADSAVEADSPVSGGVALGGASCCIPVGDGLKRTGSSKNKIAVAAAKRITKTTVAERRMLPVPPLSCCSRYMQGRCRYHKKANRILSGNTIGVLLQWI